LSEGTISIGDDGFAISVGADTYEVEDLQTRFRDDSTGKRLPHRLRFTLAHEIAHTFFFDLNSRPPKNKVHLENPRTLHALEMACNTIAGGLLLPKEIFERRFAGKSLHDPDTLSKIANTAHMSKPALISRLAKLGSSTLPPAIFASVRRKGHELVIEAVWRHYSFHAMFSELKAGAPLQFQGVSMQCLKPLQIYGGSFCKVSFDVSLDTRVSDRWKLSAESAADTVTSHAFIVTLTRPRDFGEG